MSPSRKSLGLLAAWALFTAGCKPVSDSAEQPASAAPEVHQALLAQTTSAPTAPGPLVAAHRKQLQRLELPALPMESLSAEAAQAQAIALAHPAIATLNEQRTRRVEVFAVYPLRPSDLSDALAACRNARCYRIELFDYSRNTALVGVVSLDSQTLLSWNTLRDRQPEIPDRIKQIALEIATREPEVREALGDRMPSVDRAIMASTKTALNGTRCERSQHLCVAPTFVQGNIAVWAIVDLTDYRVVGVQWTELANASELDLAALPGAPSEQRLADATINARYCEKNTRVERDGWQFDYMLTASDGLRIADVAFAGAQWLKSAKLVDWHVNYSEHAGFGYSDAVGCPSFSSAAVVPFAAPTVTELLEQGKVVGFRLMQEFRSLGWPLPCNYSYRQAYDFYRDGRFRPTATSIGAGCGNDGTYRPVMRFELAGTDWQFSAFESQGFQPIRTEQFFAANGQVSTQRVNVKSGAQSISVEAGARFLLQSATQRFAIEPARAQFSQSRGDFEWVYVSANHAQANKSRESGTADKSRESGTADKSRESGPADTSRGSGAVNASRDEGSSDLITLGPCCNVNHEQGPERYLNDESLQGELVIWYVPQLKNEVSPGREYCWANLQLVEGVAQAKTYPCEAGPMFRPLNSPSPASNSVRGQI